MAGRLVFEMLCIFGASENSLASGGHNQDLKLSRWAPYHFMHRFPNKSVIFKFRIAALLFIARCVLPTIGLPLMLWAMLMDDYALFLMASGMLGAFLIVVIIQWILAAGARCPLCHARPLIHSGCVKNRKARRFFFSYRLQVSLTSLFKGYFRCQYCGEPAEMKARERVRM